MPRTARVSFKDASAGRLEETASGGTRFVYRDGWAQSIACCFSADRREHEWAQGLHPFFQHIAPEGWLREKQARVADINQEDDFGLLLRYGADCIGAVGVLPENDVAQPTIKVAEAVSPGRTVSGVQRKLLVVKDDGADTFHPAAATGPAPFIAKFNSKDLETLVRNEQLSLRWAAAVLGSDEVTEFRIAHVSHVNELALIVTRFDRGPQGEKLRAEDFAQILCKPRGQDYGGKYESSYEEVARGIRENSVRPEIDLANFFRRLLVYVLLKNADAHLKNFTLLERPEGLRLSPVYDVINVGVYRDISQQLALSICGDYVALDDVTIPLLDKFAASIGLSRTALSIIYSEVRKKAKQAERFLPNTHDEGRDPFAVDYAETVRNQCRKLLDN